MENLTINESYPSSGYYHPISALQQQLTHILAFVMLGAVISGTLGNLISVYIFTRSNMRSSVNVLLAGLSANDMVLLLLVVPVFVLGAMPIWENIHQYSMFQAYMLQFIYPFTMVSQTSSVLILVLITFERWIAVCRPLKAQIWCTTTKSKVCLFSVFVFAFVYNTCRFWEYAIRDINGTIYTERILRDFRKHPLYMLGYYTACYLVTHFVVPFTLILCLNLQAAFAIIKMRKERRRLTRFERGEHKTTIMMFAVIIIFATCNTLPFIMNFLEAATPDLFRNPDTIVLSYVLNDVSNLLVVLNSATNAVIYYIFSQKYRQLFRLLLCTSCGSGQDSLSPFPQSAFTTTNINNGYRRTKRSQSCAQPNIPLAIRQHRRLVTQMSFSLNTTSSPSGLFSKKVPLPNSNLTIKEKSPSPSLRSLQGYQNRKKGWFNRSQERTLLPRLFLRNQHSLEFTDQSTASISRSDRMDFILENDPPNCTSALLPKSEVSL